MQIYMNTNFTSDKQWDITSVKLKDGKTNTTTLLVSNIKAVNKMLNGYGLQAATTEGKAFKRAIKNVCEFSFINADQSVYADYNESKKRLTLIQIRYSAINNEILHDVATITKDSRGVVVMTSNDSQFRNISCEKKSMTIDTQFKKLELRGTGSLKRADTAKFKNVEDKFKHLEDVANYNAAKTELMIKELNDQRTSDKAALDKLTNLMAQVQSEISKRSRSIADTELDIMVAGGEIIHLDDVISSIQ